MNFLSLSALILLSLGSGSLLLTEPQVVRAASQIELPKAHLHHARELMGSHFENSPVRAATETLDLDSYVHLTVKRALPEDYKNQAPLIASTIIRESKRHGFDPIFLMAVIQNESSFRPKTRGSFGEIGLMQVKPTTAEWLAKRHQLPYESADSLLNPVTNIKLGAAYLGELRVKYQSESRLYLAAYNMGDRNVARALKARIKPRDYAFAVMNRYLKYYEGLKAELRREQRIKQSELAAVDFTL